MPSVTESRSAAWERASWLAFLALFAVTTLAVAKVPFLPDTNPVVERFTGPEFSALTVFTIIAAMAWFISWILGERAARVTRAHLALAATCVVGVASTVIADVRPLALVGESGRYMGLVTWLCLAVTLLLATQLVRTPSRLGTLSRVVIIVGVIQAVIGLSQVLGIDILRFDFPEQYRWMLAQGVGTVGNPNQYSTTLIVPFILACAEALSAESRRWRYLAVTAMVVTGIAIVASATRGTWIGALVGAVIVAILAVRCRLARGRAIWIGAAVLVGTVALGSLLADPAILGTRFDQGDANGGAAVEQLSSGRLALWRQGVDVFGSHPVLGVGPDSIRNAYKAAGHSTGIRGVFTDDPHSLPLLVAVSFGAVGLGAAAWLLWALLSQPMMRVIRDPRSAKGETFARMNAWFAGSLALLVTSLVSVISIPMMVAVAVAVGTAYAPFLARTAERRAPAWSTVVAGVLLIGFAGLSIWASLVPLYHNARITAVPLEVPLSENDLAVLHAADSALPWRYEMLSRRTNKIIEQASFEYSQGSSSAAEARLAQLREQLDQRVQVYPAEYFAWYNRAKAWADSAAITGDRELGAQARDIIAEALERFPDDLELMALSITARGL